MDVKLDTIPEALRDLNQWICWAVEIRTDGSGDQKETKVPRDPTNPSRRCDPTDPTDWVDFETAAETVEAHAEEVIGDAAVPGLGLGFCFNAEGLVAGVDLDDCRDPETSELDSWAREIVDRLDSWTEVSTSGTGLHVFVLGFVPEGGNRKGQIEMYDADRYFAVTGRHLDGTPKVLNQRQRALAAVHAEWILEEDEEGDGQHELAEYDRPPVDLEDSELLERARNAKNGDKFIRLFDFSGGPRDAPAGYPSRSEADLALCGLLAFWTGPDPARVDRLFRRSGLMRDKWDESRGGETYGERTIGKGLEGRSEFYDPTPPVAGVSEPATAPDGHGDDPPPPPDEPPDEADDGLDPVDLFTQACNEVALDPNKIEKRKRDGEVWFLGVADVIGHLQTLPNAHRQFRRNSNELGGQDRRDVFIEVAWMDLGAHGEFFQTEAEDVYYFYEPDLEVVPVTLGSDEVTRRFRGLIEARLGIRENAMGRSLFKAVARRAARRAPERAVHRFAAWDEDGGELYLYDYDSGYFVVDGSGEIERRPNGTDVFFLSTRGEPVTYLESAKRATFDGTVPGELPPWAGSGDLLHRLITNRINYSEGAATGPADQRLQLYMHLHALPFIERLNARPIMAWVGEKGSGKTVIQRSIGRFVFGSGWQETLMPDEPDDFLAIVANRPLAFVDNFDEGKEWANDLLAAVATGAGVFRREYYTTLDLSEYRADCFLSITSRDPPFRRDDVADRTLVFHLERLESFLATREFLRPIEDYRDDLWSEYLDNLDRIVAELAEADLSTFDVAHRMADWATLVVVAGEALEVDGIEAMLEVIQTEQAAFSLEDDVLRIVLDTWLKADPTVRGTAWTAGELYDELVSFADDEAIPFAKRYGSPLSLGKRLSSVRAELDTLYGFEVDETGKQNTYAFVDDSARQSRF